MFSYVFPTLKEPMLGHKKRLLLLTKNSQVGLGCSHRHGEEGAGVHAFIRQGDVADADGQLRPRRVHKLDPVVP